MLAISLDSENILGTFFEGVEMPDLIVGWAGWEVKDELDIIAVPLFFLLDSDRAVVHSSRGFDDDDEAVRDMLDRLLASP